MQVFNLPNYSNFNLSSTTVRVSYEGIQATYESDLKATQSLPKDIYINFKDASRKQDINRLLVNVTKHISREAILNQWQHRLPYLIGCTVRFKNDEVVIKVHDGQQLKESLENTTTFFSENQVEEAYFFQLDEGHAFFEFFAKYRKNQWIDLKNAYIKHPQSFFDSFFKANKQDPEGLLAIAKHYVAYEPEKATPYLQLFAQYSGSLAKIDSVAAHCGIIWGTLSQFAPKQFVYVTVHKCYQDILYQFVSRSGYTPVDQVVKEIGPHIKVVTHEEAHERSIVLTSPKDVSFVFQQFTCRENPRWHGVKEAAIMKVGSLDLEKYRESLGLSPKPNYNSFHMTFGVLLKKEEELKEVTSSGAKQVENLQKIDIDPDTLRKYSQLSNMILQNPVDGLVYVPVSRALAEFFRDTYVDKAYEAPSYWEKGKLGPHVAVIRKREVRDAQFKLGPTFVAKFNPIDIVCVPTPDWIGYTHAAVLRVNSPYLSQFRIKNGFKPYPEDVGFCVTLGVLPQKVTVRIPKDKQSNE